MRNEIPPRAGGKIVPWLIAVGFQSVLAVMALSYANWLGYSANDRPFGDVLIYFGHAVPILEGRIPYRDYPVEYPILAFPSFVAPLIAGRSFATYRFAFVAEMLLINAAAVWLVAKRAEESEGVARVAGRLAWYSAFFVALCPMIVVRFDLLPMLLAFAAARWFDRGRMVLGGIATGSGMLVKVVPGLVFLPFLVVMGGMKPRLRALVAIVLTVGVGAVGWWMLAGDRLVATLRYHGERGLEIGSVYGSAYLVAHKLAGVFVITHFDHGSMNLAANGSRDAASLATVVQAALLLLVAGRARAAEPGQGHRFAAASLAAYIVAGKVLSPQYLIWLIPFVCVLEGSTGVLARWVFLASCLLTTWLFPGLFRSLIFLETLPVVVLLARNLTLVALFVILLGPRLITPTRSSQAACS